MCSECWLLLGLFAITVYNSISGPHLYIEFYIQFNPHLYCIFPVLPPPYTHLLRTFLATSPCSTRSFLLFDLASLSNLGFFLSLSLPFHPINTHPINTHSINTHPINTRPSGTDTTLSLRLPVRLGRLTRTITP